MREKAAKLLRHPTFVRDLSRALVLGVDYPGPFTPGAWDAALRRGPARSGRGARWLRRRFRKGGVPPAGPMDGRGLVEAVLRLEGPFSDTLVRHFYNGVSLERVAEFYARSERWAEVRLAQSLERLRHRLDALYGYDRGRWCRDLALLAELRDGDGPSGGG